MPNQRVAGNADLFRSRHLRVAMIVHYVWAGIGLERSA
jgi:hypothetical protein